ncbi:hypothetical protein INR49_008517 [Caranx melampygus]|nr:hypothetical protein INR49_008517 [Caranx melampygus]
MADAIIQDNEGDLQAQIILPPDYPSAAPPIYQINAAWLRGPERAKLANSLEDLYVENMGESILYLWVEKIREFLVEKSQSSETVDQPEEVNLTAEEEVKMVLEHLYENKKIASATHNIYAYRIYCEDKHSFLQDCEDDGETAAGGRLLHLLQILDVRNVMVVVSRWYGGILLGPDRFKHINNCARNILVEEGYTASSTDCCPGHLMSLCFTSSKADLRSEAGWTRRRKTRYSDKSSCELLGARTSSRQHCGLLQLTGSSAPAEYSY